MKRQISLSSGLFLFAIGFVLSLLLVWLRTARAHSQVSTAPKQTSKKNNCDVVSFRRGGYELVKPLLYVEKECESEEMAPVKIAANEVINKFKASNDITTAAIYIRDLEKSSWIGINENEPFHPASLFKVPNLMAYLHKAQLDPTLLDQEYLFEPPPRGVIPPQNYLGNSIEPGKKYSVRQLLHYTIAESDNNAHWLLHQKIDYAMFNKVFQDINLSIPIADPQDSMYRISAREYSVFFRTLYNASYLSPDMSSYALSILSETKFAEGFLAGFPPGTKVAHKFGEHDNGIDCELHESGIIYVKGKAYLITIMTAGKTRTKLPNVLATLAQTIYKTMFEP